MAIEPAEPVVVADVGKTSVRVEYRRAGEAPARVEVAAGGVLGGPGGTDLLLGALEEALGALPRAAAEVAVACVGIAGWLAHPALHEALAERVGAMLPAARVGLTSDLVVAHAGALGGGPGTVLIAGTGAVALGIAEDGEARMADGLGPLLGDEGGGAWIGREGLAAALRAVQGRGPESSLVAAAADHFEVAVEQIPGLLLRRHHPVRDVAGFVQVVLRESDAGCAVAAAVVTEAADRLATTASAAAAATGESAPIALTGSLMLDPRLRALTVEGIVARRPNAAVRAPLGDALDGAALLAAEPALAAGLGWLRLSPAR